MRISRRLQVGLVMAALSVTTGALAQTLLTGAALDRTVSGRRIFLATPLGGEFPLNYYADGRVDGQGEAAGMGRFVRPNDSGKWWVSGQKLCQKWTNWYDGKVFCFTLQKVGEDKLAWRRDDGLEGTARIGR
ncbi:MAG: hypothetical protein JWN07_2779 [Hyphomicrobiales bacterium]|nr:hypothetical protein [Hyphomicrobiales bacterium]